ncbi:MAG: metallophosphoesterase [Chlorobi bacterium]|nr:metallophosphoesterase [Chlorobiota bacterium]
MTLSRRQFLAALAISSVGAPKLLAGVKAAAPPPVPARRCSWVDNLNPKTIAIVGDVQRTSMAEYNFMGRAQNDTEREAILNAIADDKPDMLLMLGDQVVTGDDDSEWAYFDRCMEKIVEGGIPVRSILGNHDYGESKARSLHCCYDRFPYQNGSIHTLVRLGSLALITLNTNLDQLSSSEIKNQEKDYNDWITELDKDSTVRGVLVAAHHPPYTNSDLGMSTEIVESFAKPFLNARKTRLFLSGHVHSYERFVAGDKMFVTSGGGGGPRRVIDISSSRPFQNDAYRVGSLRPFHYIRLKVGDNDLKAEVVMLQKGQFKVGDRFSVGLYG